MVYLLKMVIFHGLPGLPIKNGVFHGFHRVILGQAAVDHNGLVPHRAQRPDATHAAPVELHAAADAVRPAAQDDDARLLGSGDSPAISLLLPSGELTKTYGKSPFLMGKSTINGNFQLLC